MLHNIFEESMPPKKSKDKVPFTIASFDIGLKNLAFCVMQYEVNGNQYPIIEWKNIDLTGGEDNVEDHNCEAKIESGLRKGKLCGGGAKIMTDENQYYCNRHNPDKEKYTARKKRLVKTVSIKEMCCTLSDHLDRFYDLFKTVDHIIIESQFSKNRKMLCLSDMLFAYFILKHIRNDDSKCKDVKFIAAKNKLTVYDGPAVECNRKNAKDKRKQLAIKYCEYMIRSDEERLKEFNKFPRKKDDLSDCFLQGAWYLKLGPGKKLI